MFSKLKTPEERICFGKKGKKTKNNQNSEPAFLNYLKNQISKCGLDLEVRITFSTSLFCDLHLCSTKNLQFIACNQGSKIIPQVHYLLLDVFVTENNTTTG